MAATQVYLSKWVVACCIVKFDIDEGQVLEFCHPPDIFDPGQEREICYLALPDSNTQKGDCIFTFRIKARKAQGFVNENKPLYGFTYFRQEKDQSVRRGYNQSSIVLFSKWPFINLFKRIVRLAAVSYFKIPLRPVSVESPKVCENGNNCTSPTGRASFNPRPSGSCSQDYNILLNLLQDIAGWPDPIVDGEYDLPLMKCKLKFKVPRYISEGLADNTMPPHMWAANCPSERSLGSSPSFKDDVVAALNSYALQRKEMPSFVRVQTCLALPLNFRSSRRRCHSEPPPGRLCCNYKDWTPAMRAIEPLGIIQSRLQELKFAKEEEDEVRSSGSPIELDEAEGLQFHSGCQSVEGAVSPTNLSTSSSVCTTPLTPMSPLPNSGSEESWQVARLKGRHYLLDDVNVYSNFRFQLRNVWRLWELMVLGRPLLIFSLTPAAVSDCTLSALAIIAPLSYAGDARPFFTVQDQDFHKFESFGKSSQISMPVVLGITNPYLAKQFSGWKNFISVSRKRIATNHKSSPGLFALNRKSTARELLLDEFREVFTSEHKFILNDDSEEARAMLLTLLPAASGTDIRVTDMVNNDTLRRYFLSLTERFLKPLRRCFDDLWSSVKIPFLLHTSGYKQLFTSSMFLSELQRNGFERSLFKGSKQEAFAFYKAFVEGPNFSLWLKETVHMAFRAELLARDISVLLAQCTEEQLIEAYNDLRAQWTQERQRLILDQTLVDRLGSVIRHIHIFLLPGHISAALQKDPSLL